MAGEWIPMRLDLWECPQVVRIMSALCPQDVHKASEKCRVIGALYRTWSLIDRFADDGILHGYDAQALDQAVGIDGWAENLQRVGWLVCESQHLEIPEFASWFGQSSKRRLKDAQRKREQRRKTSAKRPHDCGQNADQRREEKRREEKKKPSSPPTPSVKSQEEEEEDGFSWDECRKRLAACRVNDVATALKEAHASNLRPTEVIEIINHYQAAGGAWNPGALHWRISNGMAGQPPAEGWPPQTGSNGRDRLRNRAMSDEESRATEIIRSGRRAQKTDEDITHQLEEAGLAWP